MKRTPNKPLSNQAADIRRDEKRDKSVVEMIETLQKD